MPDFIYDDAIERLKGIPMGKNFDSLPLYKQLSVHDLAKKRLGDRGITTVTQEQMDFMEEFIASDPKDVREAVRFCNSNYWMKPRPTIVVLGQPG